MISLVLRTMTSHRTGAFIIHNTPITTRSSISHYRSSRILPTSLSSRLNSPLTRRPPPTATFATSSSSSSSNDEKQKKKPSPQPKPRSKKIKINPNWQKDYDPVAAAAAFDELARKEGFDDTSAIFADHDTFDDDFVPDDYDNEYTEEEEEDDEELDFGSDDDDDDMEARIARARRDLTSSRDPSSSSSSSHHHPSLSFNDISRLGFKRESNPYGRDETPRRFDYKLAKISAMTCSACGADFQSHAETSPGFLPPEKFGIQKKIAAVEEALLLKERAEGDRGEWSPEEEIEYLIKTSGDGGSGADEVVSTELNVDAMAKDLGLDLEDVLDLERRVICKRCHHLQNFGTVEESLRPGYSEEPLLSQESFRSLLAPIKTKPSVIIALVDIFDFTGSVLPSLDSIAGPQNPVILAANKADLLLPSSSSVGKVRIENWVRRELEYMGIGCLSNVGGAVTLVSCKTGFGIASVLRRARDLAERLEKDYPKEREVNIYVVGAANAGKSTLINHILESKEKWKDKLVGKKYSLKKKVRAGAKNKNKGMVTTSPLPGTTLKFIRVDLEDGRKLYDTPGLLVNGTLTHMMTPEELKMVVPKKPIEAITFRVAANKCILIGGLARITVLEPSKPFLFTFYISNDIKLHATDVSKADDHLAKHSGSKLLLTPPLTSTIKEFESHILDIDGCGWKEVAADIALRGLGWVGVTGAGSVKVEVQVPKGVGVSVRPPLMPFDVWESTARYTGGRAIRKSGRSKSGKRRSGVGRR